MRWWEGVRKCGSAGVWAFLRSLTLSLLPLLLALPAQAQDTTRTPADTLQSDTLRAPADTTARDSLAADTLRRPSQRTLSEADAVPFDATRPGRAVTRQIPARDPALDATEILARVPGAFRYDFGAVGWPHAVSFRGRPPDQTALTLDGLPFNDPLTGRPRYDLLPLPFLAPLHAGFAALGAPNAVSAAVRPYRFSRPLTELRYRFGGFQSIGALHTQRRRVGFFGQPAFAQFTGGYFGRASDNAGFLPGSQLRRERRLLGRVRYRRRGWALAVMALHNRRRIGANGGVILPDSLPGGGIPPIQPISPSAVRFTDAERRLIRTDLAATLRLRTPLAEAPLTATAYWTAQTHRYRNPDLAGALGADSTGADTLAAETDRYGLRLTQRLALETGFLGRHDLQLAAHAWTDRASEGNALPGGDARARLHLSARDSTRLLGSSLALGAGFHAGPVQTYPSASARLERPLAGGALRFFAEARLAGQPVAWIEEKGFGPLVEPLPGGQAPGAVLSAQTGARTQIGSVGARLAFFANRTTDRLYLYATGAPATARAALAEGVSWRTGGTLSARWRAGAERGFYASAGATAFLNASAVPYYPPAAPTVPRVHGRARLGARYAFFTEDLNLDAYAEGRFWSRMTSRALHTPTGRLVLPPPGSPVLGPAATLDLHAEATIRTATLFVSYENALNRDRVQTGSLVVPVYPIPRRRLRFGVYWPIFN